MPKRVLVKNPKELPTKDLEDLLLRNDYLNFTTRKDIAFELKKRREVNKK